MIKPFLHTCAFVMLCAISCKKPDTPTAVACKTVFFGYNGIYSTKPDSVADCTFGIINRQTASSSTLATFLNTVYAGQGVYNTSDKCYYAFRYFSTGNPILYRVNLEGVVTELKNFTANFRYEGLVFSRFDNKLYAFQKNKGSVGVALCQIIIKGNEFSTVDVMKHIGWVASDAYISATVDNATGNIYYNVGAGKTYNVYCRHPRDSVTIVIAQSTKSYLLGLCFNPNDNMLYGIKQDTTKNSFVKISLTGAVTTIDTLPFTPKRSYYSACIDRCANEYIISGKITNTTGYLIRVNMSGSIISRDTTQGIFHAITVAD